MVLLSWGACITVPVTTHCRSEHVELADDEGVPGIATTPSAILDVVEGPFAGEGAWEDDGTLATVQGEVARGDGPATGSIASYVERKHDPGGIGFRRYPIPTIGVVCMDAMAVPVVGELETSDGRLRFAFDGTAVPQDMDGDGVPRGFEVSATIERDTLDAAEEVAGDEPLWVGLQWGYGWTPYVSIASFADGQYVQILETPGP